MANPYEKRKMVEGPGLFILLIPFGSIIFFILFDFCFKYYNDYDLAKDTEYVLTLVMEKDSLETYQDMKSYAIDQFKVLGYEDLDDMSLIIREDCIILVNYRTYFTMMGIFKKNALGLSVASYKGYYNEYKETVVEKLEPEEVDEEELEEEVDPDTDIIIK